MTARKKEVKFLIADSKTGVNLIKKDTKQMFMYEKDEEFTKKQ